MTLKVQGTISMNGAQAKAEAKAVAAEVQKVAGAATGMATASKEAGAGARTLAAGAADAAGDLRVLAAAERQAASDAVNMGRQHGVAAGQIGNLTAQFNDIGVMLAAGQNPLQLALQQGTQITQVFGNMGAAAAVRSVGQAFLSMLSPLNLVTIGGIALGATIFQWAMESGEEVETLSDRLDGLKDSLDAYSQAAEAARTPSRELAETYGRMSREALAATQAMAEAAREQALANLRSGASAVAGQFGGFDAEEQDPLSGLGSDREDMLRRLRRELGLTGAEAIEVAGRLEALGQVQAPDQIAVAANKARDALMAAGVAADSELAVALAKIAQSAAEYVGIQERAQNVARQLIGEYQAQADINQQIALFGQDSWLVAQSKLAVERESVAALLEAEGITGALADQVLAAWDNAEQFNAAGAVMASVITEAYDAMVGLVAAAPGGGWLAGAIADASSLARELWDAATAAAAAAGGQPDQTGGDFPVGDRGRRRPRPASSLDIDADLPPVVRSRGGASSAREETRAVDDLIDRLEREIALEREMDPVKREMIRYREQLKDATAAERAEVEQLILQREREKAVTESLRWVGEQTGNALVDALMGASDAGEKLIETLKRAVLQALLLGTGPLGSLFGGGLFGGFDLFSGPSTGSFGLPFGQADGGMVYGEGGPRDDKVPRWLSAGEFVVNAAATRRHRRQLEAINAPGLASGGFVGPSGSGGGFGAEGGGPSLIAHVDARGSSDPSAVEAAAKRGMQQALEEFRRGILPQDVRRIFDKPRTTRF